MTDLFRIRDHVADFEGHVAGYRAASAATRARLRSRLGLAYGAGAEERIDLYFPDRRRADLPVHLFVHGGYWRAFSREDYAFVADAITDAGAIAAVMDYALMPAARMETLVGQVRRASAWLADTAPSFGGDPARLTASGHSAGAHLASYLVARGPHEPEIELPPVQSVLLLSGVYDLAPLTRSFLQAEIGLTDEEVRNRSPLSAAWTAVPATVVVGARETMPVHEQARALSGERVVTLPGEDHMTIIRAFGTPGTQAAGLIRSVVEATRGPSQIAD